ncbi:Membrane protein OS=Streptomyces microflavus OX=1919 GN=Smic_10380 PE=4 SV=1 [Streptomyces microflavus]
MLGGLLLLIPGLISDAAGLLLLVPPVRTLIGRRAERSLERRMRAASPGSLSDAFQQARMHRPDGKVVQGEVIREDGTQPPSGPEDDPRGPRPPLTP